MIHDTLKLARGLEPAFTRDQAETLTTALAQGTNDSVATKSLGRPATGSLGSRYVADPRPT